MWLRAFQIIIACVGGFCTVFMFGIPSAEYLARADTVAERLSPEINVDVAVLRPHLQKILGENATVHGFIDATPPAAVTILALLLSRRGLTKTDPKNPFNNPAPKENR